VKTFLKIFWSILAVIMVGAFCYLLGSMPFGDDILSTKQKIAWGAIYGGAWIIMTYLILKLIWDD
jgi:hypothetical protein